MRVIRLVDGSNQYSLPVIYLHTGNDGECRVNGKPAEILGSGPGHTDSLEEGQWQIVFSLDCPMEEGAFVSFGKEGPVLSIGKPVGTSFSLLPVKGGFVSLSQKTHLLRPVRVGILTVSDKGSRGERKDTAGPALEELVIPLGATVSKRAIVPDDRSVIAGTIRDWADADPLHLILVTGGTGLSERDVTPEALQDVADRIVPGLGEAMRRKTEPLLDRSILSRGLAVTRNRSLVIAFPGSERGARQCYESISGVLRHAIDILNGWEGECAAQGGHGHSHG
jgi:molybdenum cofactor synthesis domain-containing protein